MAETYPADTLLAVDFGTATTRAALFDVVEGRYRFVACGEAPSTIEPPYSEATEGMRQALAELQAITGRTLLDGHGELILPSTPDGTGADLLVATASGGPALRAVLVGLLPNASLESARRLAGSNYVSVAEALSLGDRRREDQQFDAVIKARPQLVVVTGGTDDGARDILLRMLETVAMACHLSPADGQTKVLYAGNADLAGRVTELLSGVAVVRSAPNVQPQLGEEVLAPARAELAKIFEETRLTQIGGFMELAESTGGRLFPTAQSEGQIVRFLSRAVASAGGVLGVSVGSASTSTAAAFKGELYLDIRTDVGVGVNATGVLAEGPLDQFTRWLPVDISDSAVRDFIHNKSAHPHTLPADVNDLHLEHALARQVIRAGLRRARVGWPASARRTRGDLLPWFDLILGSGATLSHAPRPGGAALILLDALQPTSPATLLLDPHHLTAALGAVAAISPMAVVQVIDSGALLNLGTVFSVMGNARLDQVVCQARLVPEAGPELSLDVKFGSLGVLPLALDLRGKLTLKPRPGMDVGFGPGRGKTVPVIGGAVGVIIDARGRPIAFPAAADERHELVQEWILSANAML